MSLKDSETLTKCPMFSPVMLGCLPIAHRRQSTSWIVLSFSSSFFLSGSLVAIVTSSPLSVLHTDLTWEFFQRSMPEFWSSLVQFVLIRLSKFLRTCTENSDILPRQLHGFEDDIWILRFYKILTPVWRITREVLDPRVERMPAISTAM